MTAKRDDKLFKNVTRYTTEEEQHAVERIDLNAEDLDEFMTLLRKGLVEAAACHEKCVQDNMALRVETTFRLSRPVYNSETDRVEDFAGVTTVTSEIKAAKVYKTEEQQ